MSFEEYNAIASNETDMNKAIEEVMRVEKGHGLKEAAVALTGKFRKFLPGLTERQVLLGNTISDIEVAAEQRDSDLVRRLGENAHQIIRQELLKTSDEIGCILESLGEF